MGCYNMNDPRYDQTLETRGGDKGEVNRLRSIGIEQLETIRQQQKKIALLEKALTDIADEVRWGIQYRYIARDALEGDPSIDLEFPPGMAFDHKGDAVTDYGPEHDTELARRLKEENDDK
jgi:hypothetical protein